MAREAVQGLADAFAMFDAIPTQAQQELVVDLGIIGRDVLAVQRRLVPVLTGELGSALALQVLVDQLRLRIGLISKRLSPYYGRFVEFGRRAQTVLVQRRRRVKGLLRSSRGRKRAEDIAATYTMHVKARAPHPFVNPLSPDLETTAEQRLASFWSNVLNKAGAAS
ncbi:hypothetical protein BH10PSE14_BH10PSE14_04380 [soil metagenome]